MQAQLDNKQQGLPGKNRVPGSRPATSSLRYGLSCRAPWAPTRYYQGMPGQLCTDGPSTELTFLVLCAEVRTQTGGQASEGQAESVLSLRTAGADTHLSVAATIRSCRLSS